MARRGSFRRTTYPSARLVRLCDVQVYLRQTCYDSLFIISIKVQGVNFSVSRDLRLRAGDG
jgi:hypothetical protein